MWRVWHEPKFTPDRLLLTGALKLAHMFYTMSYAPGEYAEVKDRILQHEQPVAREVGAWTLEKLGLLRNYMKAYVDATTSIEGKVSYLDVCSGPGLDKVRESSEIHHGSPLIAMDLSPKLNNFVFIDIEKKNIEALNHHIVSRHLSSQAVTIEGDCNTVIGQALQHIPNRYGAAFAFIDPAGLRVSWQTIRSIALHKANARYKIELFILFPYDMGVRRFFVSGREMNDIWPNSEATIDRIMPDAWRWKRLLNQVETGQLPRAQLRRRILYVYWKGLRDLGYEHVASPRVVKTIDGRPLYHMFFTSDHPAGDRIMSHVLHTQRRLGDTFSLPELETPYSFSDDEDWYARL